MANELQISQTRPVLSTESLRENFTPANIARAAIEGVIAGMRYAADAIEKLNVPIEKVVIVGGAARNKAVQEIASTFFNFDIAIQNRANM
jgi:xylulokinase